MGGGALKSRFRTELLLICNYLFYFCHALYSVDGFDFGLVLSLEETRAPHYRTVSAWLHVILSAHCYILGL